MSSVSIAVTASTLPTAWEQAVRKTWHEGRLKRTAYDKPTDPNSRDVAMLITVTAPMSEPRIHRCFPGGLNDLEKYRSEVLFGVHDHWIDPKAGKWSYTYHNRMRAYTVPGLPPIDQIGLAIQRLKQVPFSRRIQVVTSRPWSDMDVDDPSCVQRLWFTVVDKKLDMHLCIRSNDAFKAAFMNMHAFTELQAEVAACVGVEVGNYVHFADSFHIYGSYHDEFKGTLKTMESRSFGEKTYDSTFAKQFFLDGCDELLAEEDLPDDMRLLMECRRKELS